MTNDKISGEKPREPQGHRTIRRRRTTAIVSKPVSQKSLDPYHVTVEDADADARVRRVADEALLRALEENARERGDL